MDEGLQIAGTIVLCVFIVFGGLFYIVISSNKQSAETATRCIQAGGSWVAHNCVLPRQSP